MKLKQIISGLLIAGVFACCAAAPEAAPVLGGAVVEASAASAPAAPTGLKVSSPDVGKVKLSWNKVSGADGIEIYRAASKTGTYKKVKIMGGSKTSTTISDLTGDKTYYFKLRSYKKSGGKNVYSEYTSAKSVKVLSENAKNFASLKKKAPLFASYAEYMLGGYPLYYDMEISMSGNSEFAPNTAVSGFGNVVRLIAAFESDKKFAVKGCAGDGSSIIAYINNNDMYSISPEYKLVVHTKITAGDRKDMLKSFEDYQQVEVPDFSDSGIKVKTETKKFKGSNYLCEKMTFKYLNGYEICTYADTSTKAVKYLTMRSPDGEVVMKFNKLSNKVDKSLFKIPSGYKVVEV